jgi:hypothetical protein
VIICSFSSIQFNSNQIKYSSHSFLVAVTSVVVEEVSGRETGISSLSFRVQHLPTQTQMYLFVIWCFSVVDT